jgi:hypothetical protein
MLKTLIAFAMALTITSCASRKVDETPEPPPVAQETPAPLRPQIKYVYVDRTPPTVSAMTIAPLEVPPAKEINIGQDILRILWPLIALLGAGAVMIAGLYFEHRIISKQLAQRSARATV